MKSSQGWLRAALGGDAAARRVLGLAVGDARARSTGFELFASVRVRCSGAVAGAGTGFAGYGAGSGTGSCTSCTVSIRRPSGPNHLALM